MDQYYTYEQQVKAESRADFVKKVYFHLALAIVSFTLIEVYLFSTGIGYTIASAMLSVSWLLVLGLFMVAGWVATRMATNAHSLPMQYAGLGVYVLAQSLIFCPLIFIATAYFPGVIESAAQITLLGTAGLTLVAFYTRKDFSFLRVFIAWGMVLALIAIVGAILFGFHLGVGFSVIMIGLAGAAILYDTSNVIHHYPEHMYVSAALQLFASVALMFWYVLQFLMSWNND